MVVRFVDIGEIVDHHSLNVFFVIKLNSSLSKFDYRRLLGNLCMELAGELLVRKLLN